MLHILWLILKIILILLGTLLGLVLFLVLLLLFCPVRYEGQGSKEGEWKNARGWLRISWLFRGISVTAFRKNGENGVCVRILGISVKKPPAKKSSRGDTEEALEEEDTFEEETAFLEETSEPEEILSEGAPAKEPEEILSEGAPAKELKKSSSVEERIPEAETVNKKGLFQRISEKLSEIRDKIKNIRLTFRNIHDKIDWWKKYIHHPKVKAAISLVWRYAKGLLTHILPTKVWGNVTFGFSDPSLTGRALGLLGMSFPLHKNCVAVTPRFDGENILEGEIHFKGRIYGIVLLKVAVVIYFNKNVKYAMKRAKYGKHKED